MLRWLPEEYSNLFQNAVSSLNKQTQKIYNCDLVLADYRNLPGTLASIDEIWDAFDETAEVIEALPGHPGEYLRAMLAGFRMILRVMQGDDIPYAQKIADMQQVESRMITEAQIASLGDRLDKDLYELGYRQTNVAEKTMAFLNDTVLPAEEVVPTTKAFLSRCKSACISKVLPLPDGDGIDEIAGVRNVIYSGNSAYLGDFKGRLSFNIDRPWSMPTFANVLCHEGYPGHHAFYCHWDVLFRNDGLPVEAAYYVKNTPTNALFEGVPENALHFLGWDDFNEDTPEITDEQKRLFALGRDILDLQRILQMQGCYLYHVEGYTKEETIEYMLSAGIFTPVEAENTFNFFTHPVQQYYYPAYYYGHWMIYEAYERVPKAKRGEFFHLLYDYPHTNETFIKEVGELIGEAFDPLAEW